MTPSLSLAPSGDIYLHIPSETGGEHLVALPFDMNGLRLLKKILSAREPEAAKIGSWASPTQYMVERWLVEDREKKSNEKMEAMRAKLNLEIEI